MLKSAGVSDDILVALIRQDDASFRLNAQDIIDLRRQGLSERVILAMLGAGRPRVPLSMGRDRQAGQSVPVTPGVPAAVGTEPPVPIPDQPLQPLPADPVLVVEPEPDIPQTVINVIQNVEVPASQPARAREVEVRRETVTEYVPVPVYVPVRDSSRHREEPRTPPPPQYWGWGGQLRPGSWQPAPAATSPPPATGRGRGGK